MSALFETISPTFEEEARSASRATWLERHRVAMARIDDMDRGITPAIGDEYERTWREAERCQAMADFLMCEGIKKRLGR